MILVDANLLIYAISPSSPHHEPARDWIDSQLNRGIRVGLPWPSLLAFLRVITNPRIYSQPASISDAWEHVEQWLNWPSVWIPLPTERQRIILPPLLRVAESGPNLVSDAALAALAIEYGLTLCSTDGDFARFPGLKWVNPLRDLSRPSSRPIALA